MQGLANGAGVPVGVTRGILQSINDYTNVSGLIGLPRAQMYGGIPPNTPVAIFPLQSHYSILLHSSSIASKTETLEGN